MSNRDGSKSGGRKAGAPNRITKEIIERLEILDFSPVDELVSLYRNPATEIKDRITIARDLAQYVYPKRKALDHTVGTEDDRRLIINLGIPERNIVKQTGN